MLRNLRQAQTIHPEVSSWKLRYNRKGCRLNLPLASLAAIELSQPLAVAAGTPPQQYGHKDQALVTLFTAI